MPISMCRYTCIESALIISPSYFSASLIARSVFPTPVGPVITITGSFEFRVSGFGLRDSGCELRGEGFEFCITVDSCSLGVPRTQIVNNLVLCPRKSSKYSNPDVSMLIWTTYRQSQRDISEDSSALQDWHPARGSERYIFQASPRVLRFPQADCRVLQLEN